MTTRRAGTGVAVEHLAWKGTFDLKIPDRVEEVFHSDNMKHYRPESPDLPELTIDEVLDILMDIETAEFKCSSFNKDVKVVFDEDDSHQSVTVKQEIYDATAEKPVLIDSILDRDKSDNSVNAMDCDVQVSPSGATNSSIITLKKLCDYNENLQIFKEGMHCSQEVVISYINEEQQNQILGSFKIVEVNLNQLKELFQHTSLVTIRKIPPKKRILAFFEDNDVSSKRCLVKCTNIVHGIVLAEKWKEISDGSVSEKKANNTFSNFQRTDRAAGKMLVNRFMQNNCIGLCSGYREIESKSGVSFDIYNKFGFLAYASSRMAEHHIVFYNNGTSFYFIKDKYLDAFGKIVVPKKKKIKRLQKH